MKMKKFVSAFLVSAVAMSLVAGCGGGDKKKAEEKCGLFEDRPTD